MFGNIYDKLLGGGAENIMMQWVSIVEQGKKERAKEAFGITTVDGKEGIERLSIPYDFYDISLKAGYIYCLYSKNDKTSVYNFEGKLLFTADKIEYIGKDRFLISNMVSKGETEEESGCSLYDNEGNKLTEEIFRPVFDTKFNDKGFAVIGLYKKYGGYVIDLNGNILLETDNFEHPYIYGVIGSTNKGYFNLLDGSYICEKGYSSVLSTDEFKFIQVELNCIYQINKNTGEYTVWGEKKKVEEKPVVIKQEKKIEEPKVKPQQRNDACACGSGKKYKNCCINQKK
jgi:hypothetical protein